MLQSTFPLQQPSRCSAFGSLALDFTLVILLPVAQVIQNLEIVQKICNESLLFRSIQLRCETIYCLLQMVQIKVGRVAKPPPYTIKLRKQSLTRSTLTRYVKTVFL